MMTKIQPVIMCGGAGTRVWPESRETMPKQFIALIGADSDEAGHAFQYEAGDRFRFEAGRGSDLMSAT